jgi:hypothetical protein
MNDGVELRRTTFNLFTVPESSLGIYVLVENCEIDELIGADAKKAYVAASSSFTMLRE